MIMSLQPSDWSLLSKNSYDITDIKTVLSSWLPDLEQPGSQSPLVSAIMTQVGDTSHVPGNSSWATVVKGKRKLSIPLYGPHGEANSSALQPLCSALVEVTHNTAAQSSHILQAKRITTSSKRLYSPNLSNPGMISFRQPPKLLASTFVGSRFEDLPRDCFSHLFSLHQWLQNLCTATGCHLYKSNGLHHYWKGTRNNIISF